MLSCIRSLLYSILICLGCMQDPAKLTPEAKELCQAIFQQDDKKIKEMVEEGQVDKKLRLPGDITPVQLAIERGDYRACIVLVKEGFEVKEKDLKRAQFMAHVEPDQRAKQARECVNFLMAELHQQKRVGEKVAGEQLRVAEAQQLAYDLNTIDGALHKATVRGDLPKIVHCIGKGANPLSVINELTPLGIAIGHRHKNVVEYYLSLPEMTIRKEDIDKANLMHVIVNEFELTSDVHGEKPSDVFYLGKVNQHGAHAEDIQNTRDIFDMLKKHMEKAAQKK